MKKQLFSRRRSHRGRRSVFDWLFKFNDRGDSSKDDGVENVKDLDETRKAGSSIQNTYHKVTGVKNMSGVPADFFLVASSSNMELSKHSDTQTPSRVSRDKLKVKGNSKRRKSLFKTNKSRKFSQSSSCPVFLYTISEGLTCMCRWSYLNESKDYIPPKLCHKSFVWTLETTTRWDWLGFDVQCLVQLSAWESLFIYLFTLKQVIYIILSWWKNSEYFWSSRCQKSFFLTEKRKQSMKVIHIILQVYSPVYMLHSLSPSCFLPLPPEIVPEI